MSTKNISIQYSPAVIVALVLFTFKSRGAAIGVFTGLERMSDLEGKLSLLCAGLIKNYPKKLQKLIFQNATDQKTINFALGFL